MLHVSCKIFMEDAYIIHGGKPLKGEVKLSGAKNVSCKLMIAALMLDQEVILHNIPRHKDVIELIHLINSLGGKAEFIEKNSIRIDGREIKNHEVDFLHASKIRTSFMLFAPLLLKFGKANIPNPGGCRLGARSIDRIIDGLISLGIDVEYDSETGYYNSVMNKTPTGTYTFSKPTHTGTELMIMIGALGKEPITIKNAALEPEVDDLIAFLNESGAKIERKGTSIVIQGAEKLARTTDFTISNDRNEAATYICMALATKGDIILNNIEEHKIKALIEKVTEAGAGVEALPENKWRFYYKGQLKGVNVTTDVHPGFMTDWQPPFAVLMTQAEGESIIHERMMENRFSSIPELAKIGSEVEFINIPVENPKEFYHFNYDSEKEYDTLAIKIDGPQHLHSGVLNIADIRAGATLVIAALVADGESIVNNVSMLERGYEYFVEKVRGLGGDIKKV